MKDSGIVILFRLVKWTFKTILVIFGVLPLARCGSGYKEKDGKITFNGEEITNEKFVVLNKQFGKDDSTAYYKGYGIPDADVKTFISIDAHYAKDSTAVFYCNEEREGQNYYLTSHSIITKIKNADCKSFIVLGDGYSGYAKDNKRGYYNGVGFEVKDVSTLAIMDGQFVKDKYQVYFEQKRVNRADAASFRILNNNYAKDTARVYYYGHHSDQRNGIHEIPCHVDSFELLEYPYLKDNESAFYLYSKIKGSDAHSFSVVGNGFSKDKAHVYFETEILKHADAATFALFSENDNSREEFNYSKDKDHVFYKGKMLPKLDIASFQLLGLGYATDGVHIYYHTRMVKNADISTFKVYEHGYGDADAEDSKNKYLEGVNVGK